MRHPMMSVLEQNPVLPAVKDAGRLEACLAQPAGVVFLLCGDILNIDRLIDRVHQAGKYAVVHADLVAGLAPREIAVDFLHRCGADGIISTRPMLLRRGRELGLLTVLRVFAIDSKAVSNLGRETEGGMPDVIEILPGTLCKVLRRLSRELPVPPLPEADCTAEAPRLTISVTRLEQLSPALLELGCPARVYIPLEEVSRLESLPGEGPEWCAVLPRVWRDRDEPALRTLLERARALGFTGVLIGNLGHLPLVRGLNFHLYGDYGLNVFNSRSLAYLKDKELESACVSFELRFAQIRDLKKVLRAEAIVYGRLPLMITENCLVQNETGCRLDRQGPCVPEDGPCRCGQPNVLVDRTGAAFPLLPAYGHRTEIQNSKPLYLADRPEHRRLGLAYARLRFTTETAEECVSVVQNYLDAAPAAGDFTRGLYERGVE